MSSENSPEQVSPLAPLYPPPRQRTGYVERLKIQRNRLKNIQLTEDTSTTVNKLLPKIKRSELARVNTSALSRSGTLESIKLPSVISLTNKSSTFKPHTKLKKKDDIFVKSLLNTYPEHVSLLSKSLPSLPSIPGSPGEDLNSLLEEDIVCDPKPVYHSKNRYQKIAFRKQLEKRDSLTDEEELNSFRSNKSDKHHYIKHKSRINFHIPVLPFERDNSLVSVQSVPVKQDFDPIHLPRRYRKKDNVKEKQRRFRSLDARSDAMSVKSDSVLNSVKPKWKENCDCMRCKMLKRQFKDGDESYKLWGQYPCQFNPHEDPIN
ncbi:uncharacterized protein LOC126819231 [Patella vulgata]|uniref:uncharacterized protein LOC126819231 n=1 Tax=Patella vulgata TaxID=6465 RepID=UPI0021808EBB|nr:uncharacterized protein LOC126819231 [Patella vulgata]